MIPKILHLCWLSGDPYPGMIKTCLRSWKRVLPDYEIKLWSQDNFDIDSVTYVREAVSVRKWAPAADYIRFWALYHYGGIYLDSDVFVRKSFDDLLKYDVFSAIERFTADPTNVGIQAAVLGSIPGHPYIADCMKYYEEHPYILPDGFYANQTLVAPGWFAQTAVPYGFKYMDEDQLLQDRILILPSTSIPGSLISIPAESRAIHCCNGDWNFWTKRKFRQKVYRKLMPLMLRQLELKSLLTKKSNR